MIKVMVVDDSAVIRGLWVRILSADENVEVVTTASNGVAALEALKAQSVDVVVLDLEMPEMDGITAIPLILKEHPQTRIIIASSHTKEGSKITVKALTLGASDYVTKPSTLSASKGIEEIAEELIKKVKSFQRPVHVKDQKLEQQKLSKLKVVPSIIAIGSSTGGPNALAEVLKNLSLDVKPPILITQHMPPDFTGALAERLAQLSHRPCLEGQDNLKIENGHMYIAPGDFHMEVMRIGEDICIKLNQNPPENYCRPSVDPMFRSIAKVLGPNVLAIVLTGMGQDGKHGCEAIAKEGGTIITQDEQTSIVWGMPGAVTEAGLASSVLPLDQIHCMVEKLTLESTLVV